MAHNVKKNPEEKDRLHNCARTDSFPEKSVAILTGGDVVVAIARLDYQYRKLHSTASCVGFVHVDTLYFSLSLSLLHKLCHTFSR